MIKGTIAAAAALARESVEAARASYRARRLAIAAEEALRSARRRCSDCANAGSWWGFSGEAVERALSLVATYARDRGLDVDDALERVILVGSPGRRTAWGEERSPFPDPRLDPDHEEPGS